jgi:hypothetical protein
MKTCRVCGITGEDDSFVKKENLCKKCNSEIGKKYRQENKEKNKRYLEENPEKRKETLKNYYYNNIDKIKEYFKTHYLENKEMIYERQKKYLQTTNGKKTTTKQNFKRRQLGHEPLNEWFKGSEAHHLRYSKTPEEQDNDITLYVPRKLHRSIPHNGTTGKNMRQINVRLLEWYFANTPEEERNPKAVKLYWNYCTLPEPDWSSNLNT